eukprot:4741899-Amphidinium_carterae.2
MDSQARQPPGLAFPTTSRRGPRPLCLLVPDRLLCLSSSSPPTAASSTSPTRLGAPCCRRNQGLHRRAGLSSRLILALHRCLTLPEDACLAPPDRDDKLTARQTRKP